jgi:hypothetical protein
MLRAPPPDIIRRYRGGMLELLIALRRAFDDGELDDNRATFTSWWRSDADNARVGGAPTSQHRLGLALDITYPGLTPAQLGARLASPFATDVVIVVEDDHVHAQRYRSSSLA